LNNKDIFDFDRKKSNVNLSVDTIFE